MVARYQEVTIKVSEITFSSTKWASHLNLEVAASGSYGIGTTELYMTKIYIKGLTNFKATCKEDVCIELNS